jgi:hypothetical protein
MFNLSSFLEKFKQLKDPKDDKVIISRIISEVIGVTLSDECIEIKKETLYVQGSALYKNRIFINKENILQKIQTSLPHLFLKDII